MIISSNNDVDKELGYTNEFETEGCGCCSRSYHLPQDRNIIIEELKENVEVIKEACELLDIDYKSFVLE